MRYIPDIGPNQAESLTQLDAIDRRILLQLGVTARASYTQLAKACRISRDTAAYRIERLQERGVLAGTRALVDVSVLGNDAYHVFLRLRNPAPDAERQMIGRISALPYVRAVLTFFGKYDLEIALVAQSVVEFDERLTQIIEEVGPALQSYEVLAITKSFVARTFPLSFGTVTTTYRAPATPREMDETDQFLLAALADDARLPIATISQRTKIPADTLVYHLRKLQEWLIAGYTPVVNYAALGYSIYAVLLDIAQLDAKKEQKVKEFLRSHRHVLWAVKTVGASNVLVYVCVRAEAEYQQTIEELRSMFPEQIRGFESLSAVAQYKYTLLPPSVLGTKIK